MPLPTARRVLASVEPYLGQWQRQSVTGARLNALRASTELRRLRREREDAEQFVESVGRARAAAAREAAGRR